MALTADEINTLRHDARLVVRELGLLNDAYFNVGVTLAERHLLIELNKCERATMGEIGEKLLIDKSTASRLIAKALKKRFLKCVPGEKDKRQKILSLSPKGRKTLIAFEKIAFDQTHNAMLALTETEVNLVIQGIALYAQGLKKARLKNACT